VFLGRVDVYTKLRRESGSGQMRNVLQKTHIKKIHTMCKIMNYPGRLLNHLIKLQNQ